MNMIRSIVVSALLTSAVTVVPTARAQSANGSLPAIRVHPGASSLVIDCHDERLPTLRAVGQVLDTNNASLLYAERERVIHVAHRLCARGAANVVFQPDADAVAPALALAATAAQ